MKILVTGSTGFVGCRLVPALLARGHSVVVLARDRARATERLPVPQLSLRVGDVTEPASLRNVCDGADLVFHLAGYAHAADVDSRSDAERHFRTTVEGTRALLGEALAAGVRRLVFVSSVKAMGEGAERCLDESDEAAPTTAYGRSRLEAEHLLQEAARAGFEPVILRLPMVYGPDNKGNLARMIAAVDKGRFPPLPRFRNQRSMVHVDDVVQALLLAGERREAANGVYLVTDGVGYATDVIYDEIRAVLGLPPPRLRVPVAALRFLAIIGDLLGKLVGRPMPFNSDALRKLAFSACYSSAKIERELGYRPSRALRDALADMVREYRR